MAKIATKVKELTDQLAEKDGALGKLGKSLQGARKWKAQAGNQRKAEAAMVVAGAGAAGAATGAGLTYDWMGLRIPLAGVGAAGLMVDDPDIQAGSVGVLAGVVYDITGQIVAKAKSATLAATNAAANTVANATKK